jgi:hypothetical protein
MSLPNASPPVPCQGASFAEQVKSIAPETLVFRDETGVSTKLTRLYARAPRGQRAYGSAPGHWRRLTVLGALALRARLESHGAGSRLRLG